MNFGYETKGLSTWGTTPWFGCRFQAPGSGNITSITAYLYMEFGGANVNFGLYNDNAGDVGTHVAHGVAESLASGYDNWKTINVSGPIIGGNYYWLVCQLDEANQTYYHDSGVENQHAEIFFWTFDDWSDNPPIDGWDPWKVSIYATYTPAANPRSRGYIFG